MLQADPKFVRQNVRNLKFSNLTEDQQNAFKQQVLREKIDAGESTDNVNFNKEWDAYVKGMMKDISSLERESKQLDKQQSGKNRLLPNEYEKKVSEIRRKAALLLIQDDLNDRNRLRKLNKAVEEAESPITNDELDRAEEGDTDA